MCGIYYAPQLTLEAFKTENDAAVGNGSRVNNSTAAKEKVAQKTKLRLKSEGSLNSMIEI